MTANKGRPGGKAKRPRGGGGGARALGDIAGRVVEPALMRRAGLTMTLLANWKEIAGADLHATTRPERVKWGRRPHIGGEAAPGTLVVAASGAAAMRLQHRADELIARVNETFGYRAIGAIAILQKPFEPEPPKHSVPSPLGKAVEQRIRRSTETVEHEGLREALGRLGRGIATRRRENGDPPKAKPEDKGPLVQDRVD